MNCSSLGLNRLPNSLVSIGNTAFQSVGNIAIDTIPLTLKYLGATAFNKCTVVNNDGGSIQWNVAYDKRTNTQTGSEEYDVDYALNCLSGLKMYGANPHILFHFASGDDHDSNVNSIRATQPYYAAFAGYDVNGNYDEAYLAFGARTTEGAVPQLDVS